jgi:lipopolysaccharide/colanic/teichoic acid biosynthesis glycosyltransferase
MQRFFDIFFSLTALFFFLPLFILVAIALKFSGEGEIFFMQERVGKNKKLFKLIKFATMLKNSPNLLSGTITLKNDPRVLPLGYFLRKTKINELPQLFNVLKGEMSFIGPRPQTERCFSAFSMKVKAELVKVRPGLSGIGSIIFRDEEKFLAYSKNYDYFYDKVIMPYKGTLEIWYVNNKSLFLYFLLIGLTVFIIFSNKTSVPWKILKNLPLPPYELRGEGFIHINF